jgi:murein DD-endopeptidase MepM/ murein hydrolase activator NlpD
MIHEPFNSQKQCLKHRPQPLLLATLWLGILGLGSFSTYRPALAEELTIPESASESAPAAAPEPITPAAIPEPAVSEAAAPEPAASALPNEPATDFYSKTAPAAPQEQPVQASPLPADPAQAQSDPDIDTKAYSIGATEPYNAPDNVVVRERSSGCQATLAAGQAVASNLCGAPPAQQLYTMPSRSATQPAWASVPPSWGGSQVSAQTVQNTLQYSVAPPRNLSIKPVTGANPLRWIFPNGERMIFPLPIPVDITSVFGGRIHPITGEWRFHSGTDLGAPMGTPVLAAYSGRVSIAEFLGGYGLSILLDHNQGSQETRYGHLSAVFVKPGQWVQQGTVIGLVGSTGNSTGPHLHFETLQANQGSMVAVDPTMELQTTLAQLATALQTARLTVKSSAKQLNNQPIDQPVANPSDHRLASQPAIQPDIQPASPPTKQQVKPSVTLSSVGLN